MKLHKDLTAPVFNLKDIYGRMTDLNQYIDKKVFIGFFRHAGCPFCNLRVHALTKVHEELKGKGMEMIFFFESKENVLLRSTFHKEVSPIPLISDPQKIWYNTYGLENSGYKSAISHITSFVQTAFKASSQGVPMHMMSEGESISTMPAEFLIDRGLVIKEVHYSERLNDRMNIDKIRAFAESNSALPLRQAMS
ncbi:MAG TPA: redoxin domain-containing protein [Cyclobacteriaceae bacterium]|jgi:peroxiredoxin|nr:redoxin domain-containing protein [Cyclobacteriaceae bacterium]